MLLLSIRDLDIELRHQERFGYAVQGLTLDIEAGEIVGLVGESGSGKSLTARAVMGLLPSAASASRGQIIFDGVDLLTLDEDEMEQVRGRRIGIMFQNPRESLNPVFTIGDQLRTIYRKIRGCNKRQAREESRQMLLSLGLREVDRVLASYPHQLSGGMAQRALLALTLACDPELLIADEPATGLDAATQTRLFVEIGRVIKETGKTAIVITHDISLVSGICDSVAVMYSGQIVERGTVTDVGARPLHPYSNGLLAAAEFADEGGRASFIPGAPPDPFMPTGGCPFHPRCPKAFEPCPDVVPIATSTEGRQVRCHLYE